LRIRIIAPSDGAKNETWWADHWVKRDLEIEFAKRNHSVVDCNADLDFYLFGSYAQADKITAPIKFCWIYSHPDIVQDNFTAQFNHVFVLSKPLLLKVANSTLLFGGSSKTLVPRKEKAKYDLVFMGNTGSLKRIETLKYLIDLKKYKIGLAGAGWDTVLGSQIEGVDYKGPYIDNAKLGEFFNQGLLSFYTGHEDMRKEGFVAVRILDIFRSSENLCISETNAGLHEMFRNIPMYGSKEFLAPQIDWFLEHPDERERVALRCRQDAAEWTFGRVVDEVERWINN